MIKTHQKFTGLILAAVFVTVMLFGLNMGMDMRQDGTMSGCMFDQSVVCPMNYEEHINHWHQTLVAMQSTQNIIFALLTVIILGGLALFTSSFLNLTTYFKEIHRIPARIWRQCNILAKLSDHILRALSDGILSPQFYNPSPAIS